MNPGHVASPKTGVVYREAPPPLSPTEGQTRRGVYAWNWVFPAAMGRPVYWPDVHRDHRSATPYRIVEFPDVGVIVRQQTRPEDREEAAYGT